MHSTQYQQSAKVIRRFGGVRRLCLLLNCRPSTIYRWTYPRSRGGTDGLIPTERLKDVLDAAADVGLVLKMEDLSLF